MKVHRFRRAGFTLVELLAVVAIITLLLSIAVPAVSRARDSAKRAATQARLNAITAGCDMFHNDFDKYPQSRGLNPFLPGNTTIYLSGAQWAALQLSGADLQGFVDPRNRSNDSNNNGTVGDPPDWNAWYNTTGTRFTRLGPYVQVDGKLAPSPQAYAGQQGGRVQLPITLFSPNSQHPWDTKRIPFYIDNYNFPILYYAARLGDDLQPFTTGPQATEVGTYDQTDNAMLTGANGNGGFYTAAEQGADLGNGRDHKLKLLGYTVPGGGGPTAPPNDTFAGQVYDRKLFDQSRRTNNTGVLKPQNRTKFLLISPGKDGLYGTNDDIRNF